jgi:hypothetical protein
MTNIRFFQQVRRTDKRSDESDERFIPFYDAIMRARQLLEQPLVKQLEWPAYKKSMTSVLPVPTFNRGTDKPSKPVVNKDFPSLSKRQSSQEDVSEYVDLLNESTELLDNVLELLGNIGPLALAEPTTALLMLSLAIVLCAATVAITAAMEETAASSDKENQKTVVNDETPKDYSLTASH